MLRRISVTIHPDLRKKVRGRGLPADLKERISTALRVPGDIAATELHDLTRAGRFPYSVSPATNFKDVVICERKLGELVSQSERLAAFVAEGPCDPVSHYLTLIFVTMCLYRKGEGRRSWIDIDVRVETGHLPRIFCIDYSATRTPVCAG